MCGWLSFLTGQLLPFAGDWTAACRVLRAISRTPSWVLFPPIKPPAWTKMHPWIPLSFDSASSRTPRHSSSRDSLGQEDRRACWLTDTVWSAAHFLLTHHFEKCGKHNQKNSYHKMHIKEHISTPFQHGDLMMANIFFNIALHRDFTERRVWGKLLSSKGKLQKPSHIAPLQSPPANRPLINLLYSSPVMWKITYWHNGWRPMWRHCSQQAILQRQGKIGSARVYELTFQGWKFIKIEKLIYHPLQVAYTSVHILSDRFKHIPFLFCLCMYVCVGYFCLDGVIISIISYHYSTQSINIFWNFSFRCWLNLSLHCSPFTFPKLLNASHFEIVSWQHQAPLPPCHMLDELWNCTVKSKLVREEVTQLSNTS